MLIGAERRGDEPSAGTGGHQAAERRGDEPSAGTGGHHAGRSASYIVISNK